MATETITLKLEKKFLEEINKVVIREGYKNRTEFIRRAMREKVEEAKLREIWPMVLRIKGASKRKIKKEEYEEARNEAFKELVKEIKSKTQA